MNNSERLHNQGDKEQVITPELKLSMELRDICINLLQEKGRNRLFPFPTEPVMQILQPVGIIRAIALKTMPQNLLTDRFVDLKREKDSKPNDVLIVCKGTNPSKAKTIQIYIQDMQVALDVTGTTTLELERQQCGKIVHHVIDYRAFGKNISEIRLATMEELETYQRYINQSSPIEHK